MTETVTDQGTDAAAGEPVLQVQGLQKHFPVRQGILRRAHSHVKAVDGVDFELFAGETLGLVGESGCGKSTTGRLLMRLEDPTGGTIRYRGLDVAAAGKQQRSELSRRIQIVFQDPYASLSPRMTVQEIVAEPLQIQGRYRDGGRQKVAAVLESVGLTAQHANRYAHEFSGGQRQRIGIARALVLDPSVLVLDEPVSALDVSIRAQVINQLELLQEQLGLAYLFISHDLSVVRHTCDRVAVMYLGKIVESGSRTDIFSRPSHPYTQALLSAIPSPDISDLGGRDRIVLRGDVPSPSNPPSGCRFRTRCWKAAEICASIEPPLQPAPDRAPGSQQVVACHFPDPIDVVGGEPVGAYRDGDPDERSAGRDGTN
ncbi:ABC transporter ATP-binding protein [Microlunatus soli]|uniref:Peptide/nickel transport system ATP-binding protein n=1 Tax=Microlunatus soli TaxID=630515 RepID=A0A1H1R345_9ACTN|nr:dipeptide ABC transporter ATP-binding protein [Microlunatus soli]SDS29399.1 peptide/nickel transport system ATP-binding protein [Microlunatus soli]